MIRGLSLALLEAYAWWHTCGRPLLPEQSVRSLDGFALIDRLKAEARRREQLDAEQSGAFAIRP
ncbi:MAG: hypothetical protein LC114_21185 [Bryobacterales bacterium]|nr:hypothetical protein [Bryobacterales bacterium]